MTPPGTLLCNVLPGVDEGVGGELLKICWCFCSKMSRRVCGVQHFAVQCVSCSVERAACFSNCSSLKISEWLLFSMYGSQHHCPY